VDFSLIFFSGDESKKYRFVMDAARYADEHGFTAIWTPERHFHRFGGLYPNPAVLGAALAQHTRRLKIRAGSVIVPLHHPIRIAEEWSVVDNLSNGRVGIALATGFSPLDFVLNPTGWEDRRRFTFDAVTTIRDFWSGGPLSVPDGVGALREVELHPKPVQPEIPLWLTCTKSEQTFIQAGKLGCHVLTGLIDMTTEELERRLQLYFEALEDSGFDRDQMTVTVLLHTYLGDDLDAVRDEVKPPFTRYLRKFLTVVDSTKKSLAPAESMEHVSQAEQDALLEFGFRKYFEKGSLMGTPESCAAVVERMRDMGVTEIACLIDFGVAEDRVLESLRHIDALRRRTS
jgi:natural product biosynthesis luciferase-like monooxygenase protein